MEVIAVDNVRGLIESRRGQYKHGIARTITVEGTQGRGLSRGVLEFAREPASADVRDYGVVRFEARPLSVSDAVAFFESLCRSETPQGYNFPLDGTVDLGAPTWTPDGGLPSPMGGPNRVFAWPSLVYLLKAKRSMSLPLGPILRHGLPILPDVPDAADEWCGFDARQLSESHQSVTLVLPDFRARIREIVLGKQNVRIAVEPGIITAKELEVRAALLADSKWRETPATPTKEGYELEGAGIPRRLVAYLVVRGTDDVIDWASISPTYGDLPKGVSFAVPEQQLAQLIADGENVRVEFKQRVQDSFPFVQSVVAFANTEGGKIFIGVNDDGTIEGTEPEKVRPRLQEWAERYCDPPIDLSYSSHVLEGRPVVVVDVPKGSNRPYLVREKGTAYVRRGATDRPVHRAELDELSGRNTVQGVGRSRFG